MQIVEVNSHGNVKLRALWLVDEAMKERQPPPTTAEENHGDRSELCVRDIKRLRPVQQGHSGTTEDICAAAAAGCHFSNCYSYFTFCYLQSVSRK